MTKDPYFKRVAILVIFYMTEGNIVMHHILSGKDSFFANFNTINNFALGKNITHVTQDCHARHTDLKY